MTTKGRMTAYISPKSPQQFKDAAGYTLADGRPALDVICIFAGNYATAEKPCLRANNNTPPTNKPFDDNIQAVLDDDSIRYLQGKGLTVLLSITNGRHSVGWSEFTSESAATDFAQYLKTDVIDKYGLDGIDVDDEYSEGTPNETSLIMVTSKMREIMPTKIISKALWSDSDYFEAEWKGDKLAGNLHYGAEMSYGGSPDDRLTPYTGYGLSRGQLSLGFWSGGASPNPDQDVQWLLDNGYAGIMVYAFESQENVDLMGQLVNAWYGPGNWNPPQ
jgi:hypothetical protein